MKAYVDEASCIGCELCANICPEVFSMGDSGLSVAIEQDIPTDSLAEAKDAAESCPTAAITVE